MLSAERSSTVSLRIDGVARTFRAVALVHDRRTAHLFPLHGSRHQMAAHESHPFNFVSLFIVHGVVAAMGVTICAMQWLLIRRWWLKKPAADQ
ncbi:hypothetical protein GGD65_006704 [Bradyrhizobium sp. CIR18]|uniref:hypothetical protein n=1 Tax=Bradyrhizobium sp. CIR18 TaxID=2663839 RepID=UPI001606199A|nr:hypothetical protein [Bradyrhizobium sp. CIR18]MBB4365636.1 hypothetical protein [Bradyrhizobium sp. CIR18]